jgi:predicted nucleic acid-binding protein
MKALIDTGIFASVLNKEQGYQSSLEFLEKIRSRKIEGFISVITIAEIISIYQRVGEEETVIARASVEGLIGEERIVPVTKSIAELAGRVKAEFKVSLGDAFIAATAILIGCKYLVTLDPELRDVGLLIEAKAPNELT